MNMLNMCVCVCVCVCLCVFTYIESTLKLVYTDDKSRVDADLVDIIKRPAMQPTAFGNLFF